MYYARIALVAGALMAGPLQAQHIRGTVVDSANGRALRDIRVSLLDSTASIVAAVRTDKKGGFKLDAPGDGVYAVDARGLALRPLTSGWISATVADTFEVTLRVTTRATVLSEVVVTAQRDSILNTVTILGMKPGTIGGRVVTPVEIEQVRGSAANYLDVLQSVSVTGFSVVRWRDRTGEHQCYAIGRNRGTGMKPCALVFVDNIRVDPETAIDIARPELMAWAIVLRPQEAGVQFGIDAVNGVLLIGTKFRGRPR